MLVWLCAHHYKKITEKWLSRENSQKVWDMNLKQWLVPLRKQPKTDLLAQTAKMLHSSSKTAEN